MSLQGTKFLKGFAILLVVISHWYRFFDKDSPLSFLYHFGFFGAALFAFLSGYGVYVSYSQKGFYRKYLYKKFCNVYLPFVIVNLFFGITLYHDDFSKLSGVQDIFLGNNDTILWYVKYILCFYLLFYFIFKYIEKDDAFKFSILVVIAVLCVLVMQATKVGSVWYTSTGGLLLGVFTGMQQENNINSVKKLALYDVVLFVTIITNHFSKSVFWGDWATLFSGLAFSGIMYTVITNKKIKELLSSGRVDWLTKPILLIGSASYYIYILHMKILVIGAHNLPRTTFTLIGLLLVTIGISYFLNSIYTKFMRKYLML